MASDLVACARAFPHGYGFDVILLDPPWNYFRSHSKKYGGTVSYPTMTQKELLALPVANLARENCALLCWVTGPMMERVFPLFDAWGFSYKTAFLVWRKVYKSGKPRCGMGHYTRSCHEYLLLAVKGSVLHHRQRRDLGQTLQTPLVSHSTKPEESFVVIEQFFGPHTRKIELFARRPRDGWTTWGLDLPGYIRFGSVGHTADPHSTARPDTSPPC